MIETVVSSPCGREMAASQIRVQMSNSNNKQPGNHSTDNGETVHCLTSFSHPSSSVASIVSELALSM